MFFDDVLDCCCMLWKCCGVVVVVVVVGVVVLVSLISLRMASFILSYRRRESVGCLFCWCRGGGL